jgi:iron(III) transport system permease protein
MLGLPLARLAVRQKSRLSYLFERLAYLGYAVPPLALALGLVFTSLALAPAIYQTLALLIWAYTIHFLAEGLGPLRASWLALPGSLEEAARALGSSAARTFLRINLPLLGPGILASFTVVFLSALKELPLTFILAPFDFPTLATRIFSFTEEGLFAQAAPYALCLLGVGLGLAGFLRLMLEKD